MDLLGINVGRILSSGAVVNFFTVIMGCLLGIILKKGISERFKTTLMTAMAFCVLYIGIDGLSEKNVSIIVVIISLGVGALLGEWINLDRLVNSLGKKIENKISANNAKIAEGFVTATLLFCVGAMTVVGSINSGISGDNSTLYSKAIIDFVTSLALSSTFGIGVMFASVSVLVIEGSITLLAFAVAPILNEFAVSQMTVIGSLLIIALAFNMLGITKIKVLNLIPAVFLPFIIYIFI